MKYDYHIKKETTGEVTKINGSLYQAGLAAGATVPNDPSHKYIIKELFGTMSRYYNLADKTKFQVFYNGYIIERTLKGGLPSFNENVLEIIEDNGVANDIANPNGRTFILSDHAIDRLEERFPGMTTKDLHSWLGSIADTDWRYETWDPNKQAGTAKVDLEHLGMRIVVAEYPTKIIVITVETI